MDYSERNRRNAASSTGPRSPEGRAKSAMNATKHGLSSPKLFSDGRLAGIFREYIDLFRDEFPPGEDGSELCREWVEMVLLLREVDRLKAMSFEVHNALILGYAALVMPPVQDAYSVPRRSAERFAKELSRLSRYEERAYARLKRIAPLIRSSSPETNPADPKL